MSAEEATPMMRIWKASDSKGYPTMGPQIGEAVPARMF